MAKIQTNHGGAMLSLRKYMPPDAVAVVKSLTQGDPRFMQTSDDVVVVGDCPATCVATLKQLQRQVDMMNDAKGGVVVGYDSIRGIGAQYDDITSPFHGGPHPTPKQTFTYGNSPYAAGDSWDFEWTGDRLARLRGTRACSLYFEVTGKGAGDLLAAAGDLEVDFTINGVVVAPCINFPLSQLVANYTGDLRKLVLPSVPIGSGDNPKLIVRALDAFSVSAHAYLRAYVESGRACRVG